VNDSTLPQPADTVDHLPQSWDLHALLQHVEQAYIDLKTAASEASTDDDFGTYSEAASYLLTARCAVDDAVNAIEVR
jgi:hypothetical protein